MILNFMLKLCVKESSDLIGLENFLAAVFSIIAELGWYSPFLYSPHDSFTPSIVT